MTSQYDTLNESLEGNKAAVQWSRELKARREKSEKLSKELMEKYTPLILKRQAGANCNYKKPDKYSE